MGGKFTDESFWAFGMSYYDLVVRLRIKILETSERRLKEKSEVQMPRETLYMTLKAWKIIGDNHNPKNKQDIGKVIEGKRCYRVEAWDIKLEGNTENRIIC